MIVRFLPILLSLFLLIGCNQAQTAPTEETVSPTVEPMATFDPNKRGTTVENIAYCNADGREQLMDVYYPTSEGPWPAVLYVHGGSWMEGSKAEGAGWKHLPDHGYLLVSVNYRLAGESKFPAMIEDVKCAVRYLRAHSQAYNIDPDRIGAIGASAGGHLTGLLGVADASAGWDVGQYTEQSSEVQAVVSLAGLFDFTTELPTGISMSVYYVFGGLAGHGAPEMATASPISYLTVDSPPFLLFHGDQDPVVPVSQSQRFYDKAQEIGAPVTLAVVENGDHGMQGENTSLSSDDIWHKVLDFFQTHLQP